MNDNISETPSPELKRLLYSVGGIALTAYALRRRGVIGIACAGMGAHFLRQSFGLIRQEGPEKATENFAIPAAPAKVAGDSTITVKGSPQEIYAFWRDVSNAPRFISLVAGVREMSPNVSLWKFQYGNRPALEVISEITQDAPGELIGWTLVGSPLVKGEGTVRFSPTSVNGYTEVRLAQWITPALPVLRSISSMLLNRHLAQNLRNFKQLFETGEIATTKGQSSGKRSVFVETAHKIMAPANPQPAGEKSVGASA